MIEAGQSSPALRPAGAVGNYELQFLAYGAFHKTECLPTRSLRQSYFEPMEHFS